MGEVSNRSSLVVPATSLLICYRLTFLFPPCFIMILLRCPKDAVSFQEKEEEPPSELPPSLRFESLVDQDIQLGTNISGSALELLKGLLDVRPWKRFAFGKTEDLSHLEYFKSFDFEVTLGKSYACQCSSF